MTTVPVLDASGKEIGKRDLSAEVFEAAVRVPLMHQVVVAGMASLRRGTHATKTRGEVAGGGVVFGPHPRDHSMRVNKKMKRSALKSALTDSLQSGKLAVISDLSFDEPKTRRAAEFLDTLELTGKVLLVLSSPSDTGAVEKSFRNLKGVRIAYARSLGVYELIAADKVVFTQGALDVVEGAPAQAGRSSTTKGAPSTSDAADDSPGGAARATDGSPAAEAEGMQAGDAE